MRKSFHLIFSLLLLWGFSSLTLAQLSTSKDVYSGKFVKQLMPAGHSVPLHYTGDFAELWNNGPLVTHPGGGFGGADLSALQSSLGMTIYGFGAQIVSSNSVADDFTISGSAWDIDEFDFYTYQTGSGTTPTINDVRVQIWNGPPNAGGSVIYGDLTTNVFSSASFSNIYRALDTDMLNNQRPIMKVVVLLSSPLNLSAGTYWLQWQFGGTLASGPWQPPVTVLGSTGNGNSLQNLAGTWAALVDVGPQDLPFIISGSSGPPCPVEAATNPDPANGATGVSVDLPTLTWTNGAGAVTNEVYFGTNPGSLTLVQSGTLATSWTVSPTPLNYLTNYYWKVVEVGDTCNSTATVWSFQTEQNPNLITVDLYPQSAAMWTGNTEGTVKTDGEINTVYPNEGWAAYDISSIPAGSTVLEVEFHGYVNASNWPYWSATPMGTVNPISDDAATIYNQIFNNSSQGVAYIYSDESGTLTPGWYTYAMGATSLADLQAAVNSGQGWFAMGFVDRDGTATYFINFDGWSQANPPYIEVTYTPPSGGNIFTDNFDSYTVGGQLACQSTNWTTWNLTPCDPTTDPYISNNYSWSPDNTVVIAFNNDLVHIFDAAGPKTSGTWYASFLAYIPTGKSGYFNTLAVFDGGISPSWAMEVYFDQGGAGRLLNGSTVAFTWPEATWFQVIVKVDLDNDQGEFMLGTDDPLQSIATWQWTRGGTIPLSVDANDLFGATANDEMYVDNYYFGDVMPAIIPVEFSAFTANASNGNVVLNWATATETNNRGFEVQRNSGNGYQVVGFVQGSGTSTQTQNYTFTDKSVAEGSYSYRLRQIDFDGTSAYSQVVEVKVEMPKVFALEQNYPNPFNPTTQINFSLAADSKVNLKVFNILGQEVTTLFAGDMAAGSHFINFNASNLSSGVYIYKLEANGVNGSRFSAVKKMVLTK